MPSNSRRKHLILLLSSQCNAFFDQLKYEPGEASVTQLRAQDFDYIRKLDADGIDAVLSTDFIGLNRRALESRSPFSPIHKYYEPLSWLGALAAITSRLGLIGTFSTQFSEPFNIARQLTSIDSLSNGRAGWNIVTSFSGETNFGDQPLPPPAIRYERAEEFLKTTTALWHSWDDDYARPRVDGRYVIDAAKLHDIRHKGKHFSVEQALDISPSPQRDPVIVQAGSSENGVEFAAKHAELVFFAAENLDATRSYYKQLKDLAVSYGRARDDIRLILGLRIYLHDTAAQAQAVYDSLVSDLDLATAREEILWELPDLDLTGLDLDDPLPLARFPSVDEIKAYGRRSSRPLIYRGWVANGQVKTLGALLRKFHNARGHMEIVGSITEVADQLETIYRDELADGIFLMGSNSYQLISERLLPELHRRGIRPPRGAVPQGDTLRARLGTRRNPQSLPDLAPLRPPALV